MDSAVVKVHPDGAGARKANDPQAIGKSRGGWSTGIRPVAADARTAATFPLSPAQAHDTPEGRKLFRRLGGWQGKLPLLVDREPYCLALAWTRGRDYADKYRGLGWPIHLIGVEFGLEECNIVAFTVGAA